MTLPTKRLARIGILAAVSAALFGTSVVQAAPAGPSPLWETGVNPVASRPLPDGPVEERVRQAIEEIEEEGQAALEALGELDSPEKLERADRVLSRIEQAAREVRKQGHNRVSERFDELNDLAAARFQHQARAELRVLEESDGTTGEKRQEILARVEERKTRLKDRWEQQRQLLVQRHQRRELPQFDFRQPKGRPLEHAPAHGLRLQLAELTDEQADAAIAELEQQGQTSLDNLGELDTPGKVHRARSIQERLHKRIQQVREKLARRVRQQAGDQLEEQVSKLRILAQAAIDELAELDTLEKQQRAEEIRARMEEAIQQLRERIGDRARDAFNHQFERNARELRQKALAAREALGELDTYEKQKLARRIRTHEQEGLANLRDRLSDREQLVFEEHLEGQSKALRRRAQAALEELGELDTPEKRDKAERIRSRIEEQIQNLRRQLAHRARYSPNGQSDQESLQLRRQADAELRGLGRLDSREKLQHARQIRARLEEGINHFQRQYARRLRGEVNRRIGEPTDVARRGDVVKDYVHETLRPGLAEQRDRVEQLRYRSVDTLREHREIRTEARPAAGTTDDRGDAHKDLVPEENPPADDGVVRESSSSTTDHSGR